MYYQKTAFIFLKQNELNNFLKKPNHFTGKRLNKNQSSECANITFLQIYIYSYANRQMYAHLKPI